MTLAILMVLLQITSGIASRNASQMGISATSSTSMALATEEADLRVLVYRDAGSAIQSSSINDLVDTLNATFGSVTLLDGPSGQTAALNQAIVDQNTQALLVDAVIFFGSADNISASGAKETFQKFLARGGGMIVAGTSGESDISINLNSFLNGYGIEIGVEDAASSASNVPDPYILARDFAPSYLPFMENVTQIIYHGANVTLDPAQDETEDDLEILFSYPLCYSDGEALAQTRETLGTVTELALGGRLVTLGSSFMFNDTFIRTVEEEKSQDVTLQGYTDNGSLAQFDNWLFVKNLVSWISGITGNLKFSTPAIGGYRIESAQDHTYHTVTKGKQIIWGSINLTSWENESISHARVELYIRLLDTVLRSSVMSLSNSQQYNATISTEDIDLERGWVNVGFEGSAPGYGRAFFEHDDISRMWVKSVPHDPEWPALSVWIIFAAGSLIFFSSAAIIWKILQEMEESMEG
ncbi:MAG: hypothetical protein ACE5OZ_17455 [Candidatus Heimdallarchaeota archaeon]